MYEMLQKNKAPKRSNIHKKALHQAQLKASASLVITQFQRVTQFLLQQSIYVRQ